MGRGDMVEKYPFRAISELQPFADKAQTPLRISWAVWGITDLFRMESLTAGDMTSKNLKDYRTSYMDSEPQDGSKGRMSPHVASDTWITAGVGREVTGGVCGLWE